MSLRFNLSGPLAVYIMRRISFLNPGITGLTESKSVYDLLALIIQAPLLIHSLRRLKGILSGICSDLFHDFRQLMQIALANSLQIVYSAVPPILINSLSESVTLSMQQVEIPLL